MPIVNGRLGTGEASFLGMIPGRPSFGLRVTDATDWMSRGRLRMNGVSDTSVGPYFEFVDTGIYQTYDFSSSLFTVGGYRSLRSVVSPTMTTSVRTAGIQSPAYSHDRNFDLRILPAQMSVRTGSSDTTSCVVLGVLSGRDDALATGGFYAVLDQESGGRSRVTIKFKKSGSQAQVLARMTEQFVGQFGSKKTFADEYSHDRVLHSIRFFRNRNKLTCEWNLSDSDGTSSATYRTSDYCVSMDSSSAIVERYSRRVDFYAGDSGTRGGKIFDTTSFRFMAYARTQSSADLPTKDGPEVSLFIRDIQLVPVVTVDTTGDGAIASPVVLEESWMDFELDSKGTGVSDLSVSRIKDGTYESLYSPAGTLELIPKRIASGHTHQFMHDNDIDSVRTSDVRRDLYVDGYSRHSVGGGTAVPSVFLTGPKIGILERRDNPLVDTTYAFLVNSPGSLYSEPAPDTTEYNVDPAAVIKATNSLNFGGVNLPTYTHFDGTHWLGRDAKFNFVDNVRLIGPPPQLPVQDQYRLFQRDHTSMFVVEVLSDSTNFFVYTRIRNSYTNTLSARARVNTDLTIFNVQPSPAIPQSIPDYWWAVFKSTPPSVDVMSFPNKHVCVVSADAAFPTASGFGPAGSPGGSAFRVFYESEDGGATWFVRDRASRSAPMYFGLLRNTSDIQSIKQTNSDDWIHQFSNANGTIDHYVVRSSNFDNKPSSTLFAPNLRRFSALQDETVRTLHASFDQVSQRFTLCLTTINGYLEVLRGPKMSGVNLGSYDTRIPENNWRSEYVLRPWGDAFIGRSLASYDKAGDLIVVASRRTDDTSFLIMRTNKPKDELDVMGGFLTELNKTSGANRIPRYLGSMYSDFEGNVVLGTAAKMRGDTTNMFVSIAKYGMLTNVPEELGCDDIMVYPQLGSIAAADPMNFDSTSNGIIVAAAGGGVGANHSGGLTVATRFSSLENIVGRMGMKCEFICSLEPNPADLSFSLASGNSARISAGISGDPTTSVIIRNHAYYIGFDATSICAVNNDNAGSRYFMDKQLIDPRRLRRYKYFLERTLDASVRGVLYSENLEMSSFDKIVWDEKLRWVTPFSQTTSAFGSANFLLANSSNFHMTFMSVSKQRAPLQPQRKNLLAYPAESITTRDNTSMLSWSGIPCNTDITTYLPNSLKAVWRGVEGALGDRFSMRLSSMSAPSRIVEREGGTSWRSASDSTVSTLVIDATNQSGTIQFFSPSIAVFRRVNFRKCYLEAMSPAGTLNAYVASSPATYSKEIYFDVDSGILSSDVTNYGVQTLLRDVSKNWRPGEHVGRFVQFEVCRVDGTAYRHMGFRVSDNGRDYLSLDTAVRFDSSSGARWTMFGGDLSVALDSSALSTTFQTYRLRITESESGAAAALSDQTAQSTLYWERWRDIGDFDMGRATSLSSDCDRQISMAYNQDNMISVADNKSTSAYQLSRMRRVKKIKYTTIDHKDSAQLSKMFTDCFVSKKPVWLFEDQEADPRSLMLCMIVNEPVFEKVIGEQAQTVSIDVEEIS